MTAGLSSIALFAPIAISNAVFFSRRASRGIEEMDENPLFAIANLGIAGGQVLKGARATKEMAVATDPALNVAVNGTASNFTKACKNSTVLKGANKMFNFIAGNINPIIVGAGALKVAGSDDKVDTYARESTCLLCMFASEAGAKKLFGMPIVEKTAEGVVTKAREGLVEKFAKKYFNENLSKAKQDSIKKFVNSHNIVKCAPGALKGLCFVGASIAGYKLGDKIATLILGEENSKKKKN